MAASFLERLRGAATRHAGRTEFAPATPDSGPSPATSAQDDRVRRIVAALPPEALPLLEQLTRGLDPSLPESEKYRIAEALSGAVYPKYKFSEHGRIFLEDKEFLADYERLMDPGNWHSLDRKYALTQLLKLTLDLEGDVAECGVYRGGSAWLMCQAIRPHGKRNHLFDSFEGLSEPGGLDGDYWAPGGLRVEEAVVRENLREFDNFVVHRGWIPAPFEEVAEQRFSFVHIDVDLYEPTRDSIAFFYPRLAAGGVILLDDYGFVTCPGARLAADQFFADKPERIAMLPTGQAFVVKKPER